jgi:hypothetical protein
MLESSLRKVKKGLEGYIELNDLEKIRECYYLMALIFNKLRDLKKRDEASHYFMMAQHKIGQIKQRSGIMISQLNYNTIIQSSSQNSTIARNMFKTIDIPNYSFFK